MDKIEEEKLYETVVRAVKDVLNNSFIVDNNGKTCSFITNEIE